jgi:metal-sulfur cluster biosynthetic enzyme
MAEEGAVRAPARATPTPRVHFSTPTEAAVRDALAAVVDPEIGMPIVEIGLVYGIEIEPGGEVRITYTLTSLGCPSGPAIDREIKHAVASLPGVTRVASRIVFQPPWSPDMMSDEARAALGII